MQRAASSAIWALTRASRESAAGIAAAGGRGSPSARCWSSKGEGVTIDMGFGAPPPSGPQEVAVVAFGTNLGDRVDNVRRGMAKLAEAGIRVTRHSCLYESDARYVVDQPPFLNGAVAVRTSLGPGELLAELKRVEAECGRGSGGQRWGPRTLDLDIIFYGGADVDMEAPGGRHLQVPHPRYEERAFVLAPLADLLDDPDVTPVSLWRGGGGGGGGGVQGRLAEAKICFDEIGGESIVGTGRGGGLRRVFPCGSRLLEFGTHTRVMGILNVTPDSFSDGGMFVEPQKAVEQACRMVAEGADFIDVGGQSTRPGADLLPPRVEMGRVIPVLEAMRREPALEHVVVSVDTFYGDVAREAVLAGAHVVNDVSGGALDPTMLATVGRMPVHAGYCLMHMRGKPQTMQEERFTTYTDVCEDVGDELFIAGEQAAGEGVEPWRVMLDPGLGFAKTFEGNVELLGGLGRMRRRLRGGALRRAPLLVGPSRKGFLGEITGRQRKEDRDVATAAAAVVAVQGGADVIRTHNVAATRDAVTVADAVYRRR